MIELERQFIKIAHRGASAYEPENTLKSFERAIELKSDMIEFDVRESLDGHLVVFHDQTVDRTTNGSGHISHKTLSELKELDAGHGEQIPTLEQVIELGKGRAKFVLEIKQDRLEEKIGSYLLKNDLLDDVYVVSFKPKRLKMLKELNHRIKTGLIVFASLNPIGLALNCGADFVAPFRWFVTDSLVKRARDSGLYTFTWTVDETIKAHSMKQKGVSGIVTNKPDII
ncbi:MAG: glycerophosphodiester phosphodiesterase family protein [Thermodesulfobacteriota bacterium]